MFRKILTATATAALVAGMATSAAAEETLRLEWVKQGQFAGFLVASHKGYYEELGLDLELLPAGPDLKPGVTVAQGTDTFGVGHPNQVVSARANEVPMVMILQHGQKSATTYISKKELGIETVEDVRGHSVGLWYGGDEHEFMAMMDAAGVEKGEVDLISQGFSIVPWLEGEYDVMQVARYNELLQVYENGYPPEKLNFLHPEDYGVALVSGGVFVHERTVEEQPELVQAFVDASLRGWKEAFADPEAAAEIVVQHNSELEADFQVKQIKAMRELSCAGPTLEGRFGQVYKPSWETTQEVMLDAGMINEPIDLDAAIINSFWDKAPAEYKQVACPDA